MRTGETTSAIERASDMILLLAHSELFTENYLHPVTGRVARKATAFGVFRLWLRTLVRS